jgi:hypothetical protein
VGSTLSAAVLIHIRSAEVEIMFITQFSPARFFRRFDHYKYFTQYSGPELERVLDQLFESELRVPAHRERLEQIGRGFVRLLATAEGVEVPADPWEFVTRCERHWYLDMVLLGLKLADTQYMQEAVRLVDVEPARAAIERWGSAVFAVPHAGPHLITPFVLAKFGFITALTGGYESEDIAGGFELAKLGELPLDQSHALPLGPDFSLRCLAQLGRGVGIMVYPEYSKAARVGGLRTSFLGAHVHVPTGVGRLALAARKPVIPVHWAPVGPHRYELRFGAVVEPDTLAEPGGVDACMLDIFADVEALVRAQPAVWEGWHYFEQMIKNGARQAGEAA